MKTRALIVYFVILSILCAAFIAGARMLGEQGAYLAQGYMMTPALAALLVRLFFDRQGFKNAHLRFGRFRDYGKFWLISVGITALSYVFYTVLGAIRWDFTGGDFLDRLAQQFAAVGQNLYDTLPPGFTPQMMLMIFFFGGLTVFNILPGIIVGFGEEFGHRGFMFPHLYRISPRFGLVIGGLIWFLWHLPLMLIVPQSVQFSGWEALFNFIILAIGSICSFTYLAYVYVKSESVWVTSLAHISLNNAAASFSYFAVIQNQGLANLGLALTMLIVVAILHFGKGLKSVSIYFAKNGECRDVVVNS